MDEGLLHAYLDGELSPVERARVDEHLAGCLACRTRLDEERQLIERATKLLAAALPPDRMAPPFSALARPRSRRFWHVRLPLAWAATVLLAIGLGWKLSEQLGRPEIKTVSGPIAVRESDSPPVQQPATPTATTSGRLDTRRQRAVPERPEPTLAQKSAARTDSVLADRLTSVAAAEERAGTGAAAPAPAAANAPSRNLAPRLQAVARDEALLPLDSAAVRAILGREPLVIPGLAVRSITRSGRAPNEIVVAQALDSTHVILLFEARQTMAQAYRDRGTAAADTRAPTAVAKAIAPDTLAGRLIGDVMVEIQAWVTPDSLKKLLRKIKP